MTPLHAHHIDHARRPAAPSRLRAPRTATLLVAMAALTAMAGCVVPVTRTTRAYDSPPIRQAPVVERYGSVTRIDEVDTTVQPTGGGTVIGAVVGGVLGSTVGRGSGRTAATVLGAVGGAVVGNNIEQGQAAAASNRYFRVIVEFEDGGRREFNYRDLAGLRSGDRVRVRGGVLERV